MKNSVLSLVFLVFLHSFYTCAYADNDDNKNSLLDNYYIFDHKMISNKNYNYNFYVFEENKNKNSNMHYNLPVIIIYKNKISNIKKIYKNTELFFSYDDNCPVDGYGGMKIIKNKILFEQIYCQDFLFVQSTTIFSFDKNGNILLDKYIEKYTDRSDPNKKIPIMKWTKKQLPTRKFTEVNERFLLELKYN